MTDLDQMLIYAARYAHNRETGAALQVVDCAIKNWSILDEKTRVQLAQEASNEATCNIDDWQKLITLFNGDWD